MLFTIIFSFSNNVFKRFFLKGCHNLSWCDIVKGLVRFSKRLYFNPLPDDKVYSSKLKDLADDNFKVDENGRRLSKPVKNTVGKEEIARYEQFLLFPQCFQKARFPGASKGVIVWELVNIPTTYCCDPYPISR